MKILLILLLSLSSFSLFSQSELSMDNVELKREISMEKAYGKSSDGIYRYYAKGETKPYTGILTANYPTGELFSWQEYENGIGQGRFINYYKNGNYQEIGTYRNNLVEGPIKKYYENGKLKEEGQYKDWRVRVGVWKYYNEDGSLLKEEDYGTMGSMSEVQEYYERGDIGYNWYSSILKKNGFK